MIKAITNKTLLFLLSVAVINLFFISFFGPRISAQSLNDSQVNEKAAQFCGNRGIGTGDAACRNGFRAGYNGKSVATECTNRTEYSSAEKTECSNGYREGLALKSSSSSSGSLFGSSPTADQCGSGDNAIKTKFNFGCRGQGNPIFDVTFTIIRFLTYGVGIAVVISIILAGIKYTSSEGSPEVTMAAKTQIQNAIIALLIYLLTFALLNFLVPGGLFL